MNTINQQTPGPLMHSVGNTYFEKGGKLHTADLLYGNPGSYGGEWIAAVWQDVQGGPEVQEANGRTLAAGFNLLDKTGRALNLDAATLGESLDLAALLRECHALVDGVFALHNRPIELTHVEAIARRLMPFHAALSAPGPTLAADLFAMGAETMREQAGKA